MDIRCEVLSCYLDRDWTYPIVRLWCPQCCRKGGHRFSSLFLLRTSDCNQYYTIATTTIFFYDFLLTLADEVNRIVSVSFATFIDSPVKDRIRLAGQEITGYVERIGCCAAFIDDLTVFAIFLAVRSAP